MSYIEEDWKDLVGTKIFKGVAFGNDRTFIKLDDKVYCMFEDPDDGYRSYGIMQGEAKPEDYSELEFNMEFTPIEADVVFIDGTFVGIEIYGSEATNSGTGEAVCKLGTESTDDYYPYCISEFDSEQATLVRKKQFEYISEIILLDKEESNEKP
jgi:hypothetical protein